MILGFTKAQKIKIEFLSKQLFDWALKFDFSLMIIVKIYFFHLLFL